MSHLSLNMRGGHGRLTAMVLTAILSLTAFGAVSAQDAEATDASLAWATPEQVERGQATYEQHCSTCHGSDIISIFKSFPSAQQFYGFVSTTMPGDAPGSLQAQQYADIIAYLGAENGMALGTEELLPDQDVLRTIRPSEFAAPAAE